MLLSASVLLFHFLPTRAFSFFFFPLYFCCGFQAKRGCHIGYVPIVPLTFILRSSWLHCEVFAFSVKALVKGHGTALVQ